MKKNKGSSDEVREVKLCAVGDRIQAEMLLELLKRNQIPAYRQGDLMDLYGGCSLEGEDIYISEENLEKARELLRELEMDLDTE